MPWPRNVLHASDFSRASSAAFAKAVEIARRSRAKLTLVHVLSPVVPVVAEGYVAPAAYDRIEATQRTAARRELDRLVARARRAGLRADSRLLTGVPHDAVVRAARRARADLLVIGTHGRTGLARLFLGSVAARIVTLAPCPVLTVRGR